MTSLVDFDRLRSFTDDDPVLEAELFRLFLDTAEDYLAGLASAMDDAAAWRALAHRLKGAASNIGAHAIAELAAGVERSPPDPERLATLQSTLAATRLDVEVHLGNIIPGVVPSPDRLSPPSLSRGAE